MIRGSCVAALAACAAALALGCAAPREVDRVDVAPAANTPASPPLRQPFALGSASGWTLRTPTHTIHTTVKSKSLEAQLAPFAAAALADQTSSIATLPRPDTPLEMYVAANRPQWATLTTRLMRERAPEFLRIDRGGFTARGTAVLFDIGGRDTLALLAHEHWHAYTQTTFRQPLPTWLEEGLGTYFEGFVTDRSQPGGVRFLPWANVERFDQLRDAEAAGTIMWLPELLVTTPGGMLAESQDSTLGYYAQLWALVHFLMEHDNGRHRAALERVLRDAATGSPRRARGAVELFTREFDSDLVRAQREYHAFVRDIVRVGAKDRIVRGESPVTLP